MDRKLRRISLRITVGAIVSLVMLSGAVSAVPPPEVGDEVPITAPAAQAESAIAFDGQNYLVVYEVEEPFEGEGAIFGSRVTAGGEVLDPSGFQIAPIGRDPDVAFDGERFLVTWTKILGTDGPPDLHGARVTTAGAVLDDPPIVIADSTNGENEADVAAGPEGFLVTWHRPQWLAPENQEEFAPAIYATVIQGDGERAHPPVLISGHRLGQMLPAVAAGPKGFFLVWMDFARSKGRHPDIFGSLVPFNGQEPGRAVPIGRARGDEAEPDVAWSDGRFVVTWQTSRTLAPRTFRRSIKAAAFTAAGERRGEAVDVSRGRSVRWLPTIADDGGNALLVWVQGRGRDRYRLRAARIDPRSLATPKKVSQVTATIELNDATGDFVGGPDLVMGTTGGVGLAYTRAVDGAGRAFFRSLSAP